MKQRGIWCVILAVCAVLCIQTAALAENTGDAALAEAAEGTYSTNIHWHLSDGSVLTLTPEGEQTAPVTMASGRTNTAYSWSSYADQVVMLVVDDGISNVGDYAFQGFANLISVDLSADVKTIGASAFADCTGLETLELAAGLETVQQMAFKGCTGLTSVSLGPKMGMVGANAFQDCEKLESITLNGGLARLDATMLSGCAALKNVTLMGTEEAALALPNGTPFRNCASVESLTISGPTSSLGANAFAIYNGNRYAVNDKGAFQNGSTDYLPTSLASADLSGIQFTGRTTALPEGLFLGCTALAEVKLPEGLTEIGIRTFKDCPLTSVELPEGVTTIRDSAFQNCSLSALTLPEGVTTIGVSTFESCASLASVSFPAGLNAVGASAFKNCSALASVKFARTTSAFTLGAETFSGCTAMTSASLHLIRNTRFALPNGVFQGCAALTSVELPDDLTSVGDSAFESCTSLASITLPKKVTTVGKRAFSTCAALRRFEVQGSGVTLGEEAFYKCAAMTAAVIPEGVTTIGNHAFQDCTGLTQAVIPSTVKTVSAQVFFECNSLEHVYYPGNQQEWDSIKGGSDLESYLSSNSMNGEDTLVLNWDKETTPVTDGYGSGGSSGGGDDTPANPGDPANAYGKNLPAKISGVSATASGVTARVQGTPGAGAVLLAASYSSGGELLDIGTVNAAAAGTYTAEVSIDGADYVFLFLLNDSAPVAEKYSLYLN
ncbi:MAG: leucine-rich repeat domain-containing protein [Oscillibacter sp.]|nr:leucine-rich repeat domain-containing protein [Oscillibacter sp.]